MRSNALICVCRCRLWKELMCIVHVNARRMCGTTCKSTNGKIRYVWKLQLKLAPTCFSRMHSKNNRKLIYSYLFRVCVGFSHVLTIPRERWNFMESRYVFFPIVVTAAYNECNFTRAERWCCMCTVCTETRRRTQSIEMRHGPNVHRM